jgi:transcriptional regulator with XRE-family HTH domain
LRERVTIVAMRDESEVWGALLRRKGLSVTDLAGQLGVTRQHAHRLLTGRRPAETQRAELEAALALGSPSAGAPLFAIGELDASGELELVPAGDAQPLFADRELATSVARDLEAASHHICVVPVWPTYAWRNLVAFHAAWGAEPEPRKLFLVDGADDELPLDAVVSEIRSGLETTLRSRAQANDPAFLQEVESRLTGYTDARLPQ